MTVAINTALSGRQGNEIGATAQTSTKVMTNGDTIFTVVGDINIVSLVSKCITTGTAAASTIQYQSAPTTGAAAAFTGASGSLVTAVAGSSVMAIDGQASAPVLVVSGANNNGTYPLAVYCPDGAIKIVIGTGPTTGTWQHSIRYQALSSGAYVIPS